MKKSAYRKFLESKIVVADRQGFDVSPADTQTDLLKPHTQDTICWAASLGRALIASSFGLAKTRTQIELARLVHQRTGKKFLVIAPLSVRHQFINEDGPVLGVRWQYCKTDDDIKNAQTPFIITNYERVRDGNITPSKHDFGGVSLDEGAVIRSLGSKTYQVFIDLLKGIPYRFVATATPDPNDYKELIYYAEWLDIMDHGQALTRYFKRDSSKAGNLKLMPSQEEKFWAWVSTWALFLYSPADLGYDDSEYRLPPLKVHWHRIEVDQTRAFEQVDSRGQRRLLLDSAAGVSEAATEKRKTMNDRIAKMDEIMGEAADEQWTVWCHLNPEQRAIEKLLKERGASYSSIYGSLNIDETERRLYQWKDRETQVLVGKPMMLGSGVNLQQCHKVIFVGIDDKFKDFIQAIYRFYRFGQLKTVDVHIIYAASEDRTAANLKAKWRRHDKQSGKMREIIRTYGLSSNAIQSSLSRSIGVERQEMKEKLFTAINNDCVLEMKNIPSNHVGLIHTSIPFGNHYEYSTQYEDFGHNSTDEDFWKQMDFLVPELLRVLKPGRVAAIHVKDRILYSHQTKSGFMETSEFSDDCVKSFKKHGFLYGGRRTILTDVVRENNSSYRLGYSEMTVDASKMGSGLPEYLLLFRKPPTSNATSRADEYVSKEKDDFSIGRWQLDAYGGWRSNGNTSLFPDELYDYEAHVARLDELERKGKLPKDYFIEPPKFNSDFIWGDVTFMRTLNTEQVKKGRENHICPLPFDIVERAIRLYSNEGDVVFDPFMGLGTVPMIAMKLDRIGYGIELSPEYYHAALKYLKAVQAEKMSPTLFDLLKVAKVVEA